MALLQEDEVEELRRQRKVVREIGKRVDILDEPTRELVAACLGLASCFNVLGETVRAGAQLDRALRLVSYTERLQLLQRAVDSGRHPTDPLEGLPEA